MYSDLQRFAVQPIDTYCFPLSAADHSSEVAGHAGHHQTDTALSAHPNATTDAGWLNDDALRSPQGAYMQSNASASTDLAFNRAMPFEGLKRARSVVEITSGVAGKRSVRSKGIGLP